MVGSIMPYIHMPYGGGISTRNMQKAAVPPAGFTAQLNPGVYGKIETNQMVSPGVNTYFPTVWNDATKPRSVVKQLADRVWMKGILVEANWGHIEEANGWAFLDKLFLEVLTHAPTKRIMLLLHLKIFDMAEVPQILPPDLRTTTSNYADGSPKYHYLWSYNGLVVGAHLNLYQFQDGLTGNDQAVLPIYTLRNRFYAFLQAIVDRYGEGTAYQNIFAGIQTSESASLTVKDAFMTGNNVTNHFKGRIALLKKLKQLFPKYMVMEDCNFNNDWVEVMTQTGMVNAIGSCATDGLLANKISFTQSNGHTGTSTNGWTNIHLLAGKIPIIYQAQGLDQDSRSGEKAKYYNYPDNPIAGWPDSSVLVDEILPPAAIPLKQSPPDMAWIVKRAKDKGATHNIVQHNYAVPPNGNNKYGQPRYNWPTFAADMDASVHANDPLGGLNAIIPDNIV